MIATTALHPTASARRRAARIAELRQRMTPVSQRLLEARRRRELSRAEAALLANVSLDVWIRLERGERVAGPEVLGRMAARLGIGLEELIPGGRPDTFWRMLRRRPMAAQASGPVAGQQLQLAA